MAGVMPREFEAAAFIGIVAHREAVVDAGEVAVAVGVDIPHREFAALKWGGVWWLRPAKHLACDGELEIGKAQQRGGPRTGAENKLPSGVRAGGRLNSDAVGIVRPVEQRFAAE